MSKLSLCSQVPKHLVQNCRRHHRKYQIAYYNVCKFGWGVLQSLWYFSPDDYTIEAYCLWHCPKCRIKFYQILKIDPGLGWGGFPKKSSCSFGFCPNEGGRRALPKFFVHFSKTVYIGSIWAWEGRGRPLLIFFGTLALKKVVQVVLQHHNINIIASAS